MSRNINSKTLQFLAETQRALDASVSITPMPEGYRVIVRTIRPGFTTAETAWFKRPLTGVRS